jgi:predicted aldo/keto reductase-like oxidoreductase
MDLDRRSFLKTGIVAAGVAASGTLLAPLASAQDATQTRPAEPGGVPPPAKTERRGDMPYRPLGRTGEKVSIVGVGGWHVGAAKNEKECARIIHTAIDRGVNFMDNCWDYHAGKSEVWMGAALQEGGYRDKVFLMTKIDGRTKKAAARQTDECLKRLQTDCIDLMQIHEVIRLEDPDRCFAEDGAIQALKDAKKAGKIRFIGFTGHKDPLVHLRMLEVAKEHGFRFDAVQMPLNVFDAHFRSFARQVLPVLVAEDIGVLGMKPFASGAILRTNTVKPVECLHYAMNLPTSTVITGMNDMELLEQALDAARTFRPMTGEQLTGLLAKTRQLALSGRYETFKTGTPFDGTAHHPEWMG